MGRFRVSLLVFGVLSLSAQVPEALRLRLTPQKSTLQVGEKIRLTVAILNERFAPVPSRRERVIRFEASAARGGSVPVRITPASARIRAGASSVEVELEGLSPGRAVVAASTEGAAPVQTYLAVLARSASFARRLIPVVYAQEAAGGFTLHRLTPSNRVPFNGSSRAEFQVDLGTPLTSAAQRATVLIRTSAPCVIGYRDQTATGELPIPLAGPDTVLSEPFWIRANAPGAVRVTATLAPNGPQAAQDIAFVAPIAAKVAIDYPGTLPIPTTQKALTFTVYVTDTDFVPRPALEGHHNIVLESPAALGLLTFPPSLELGAGHAFRNVEVRVNSLPPTTQPILVEARDTEEDFLPGELELRFQSQVRKALLVGRQQTRGGAHPFDLTVQLVDGHESPVKADWDRPIQLIPTKGKVGKTEVVIPAMQDRVTVSYQPPREIGLEQVKVSGTDLEQTMFQIEIVAAPYALVLFAMLGGIVGGFERFFHQGFDWRNVLPSRGYHPAIANALRTALDALYGVMLFWAVQLALPLAGAIAHDRLFLSTVHAFFYGVLGGAGGSATLTRLLDRVLPGKGGGGEAARPAAAS